MNFPNTFIGLTMQCISSVSYSVLINGRLGQSYSPQRGLRQRGTYSFYVQRYSLVCWKKAEELHLTNGIKIAKSTPIIANLLSADYSIIFSKANMKVAYTIAQIFQAYGQASWQQVNLDKN